MLATLYCAAGDLLAALLLARTHQSPDNLAAAVEAAVASLQGVLAATAAAAAASGAAVEGDRWVRCHELPQIACIAAWLLARLPK